MQNKFSTVGNFISSFLTAVIVIIAVLAVLARVAGWNFYSVDSYSMSPSYPMNSLIIVQNIEPENIEVGDVITYVASEDGLLVTHRVTDIDTEQQTFTTKGDANEIEDASPILWGNVIGKVFLCIPALGRPLRYLTAEENRPIVIGLILAVLLLAVGWDILGRRLKKKKGEGEENEAEDKAEDRAEL